MRTHLYRGKRIDNGEWVYGYYLMLFTGRHFILTGEDEDIYASSEAIHGHFFATQYFFEIDPETVGQQIVFAGNKVYEGDYWIDDVNDLICVVEFNGERGGFIVAEYGTREWINEGGGESYGNSIEYLQHSSFMDFDSLPIISSIYDNPELLKEIK